MSRGLRAVAAARKHCPAPLQRTHLLVGDDLHAVILPDADAAVGGGGGRRGGGTCALGGGRRFRRIPEAPFDTRPPRSRERRPQATLQPREARRNALVRDCGACGDKGGAGWGERITRAAAQHPTHLYVVPRSMPIAVAGVGMVGAWCGCGCGVCWGGVARLCEAARKESICDALFFFVVFYLLLPPLSTLFASLRDTRARTVSLPTPCGGRKKRC